MGATQEYKCLQKAYINALSKYAQVYLVATTTFLCGITTAQGVLISWFNDKDFWLLFRCLFSYCLVSFVILCVFSVVAVYAILPRLGDDANSRLKKKKNVLSDYAFLLKPMAFGYAAFCSPGFGPLAFLSVPLILDSITGSSVDQARGRLVKIYIFAFILFSSLFSIPFLLPSMNGYLKPLLIVPSISVSVVAYVILSRKDVLSRKDKWEKELKWFDPQNLRFIILAYLLGAFFVWRSGEIRFFSHCYWLATVIPILYAVLSFLAIHFSIIVPHLDRNDKRSLFEKICGSQKIDDRRSPVDDVVRINDGYCKIVSLRYFNPDPDRQGEGGYVACSYDFDKAFPLDGGDWFIFLNIGGDDSPLFSKSVVVPQNCRRIFFQLARQASQWFIRKERSESSATAKTETYKPQFLLKWSLGSNFIWFKAPWESAEALGIPDKRICNLFYPPGLGIVDRYGRHCKVNLTVEISLKENVKDAFVRVAQGQKNDSDLDLLRRLVICCPLIFPSIRASLLNKVIKEAKKHSCVMDPQDASSSNDQETFMQNDGLMDVLDPKITEFTSITIRSSCLEQAVLDSGKYDEYSSNVVTSRTKDQQKYVRLRELEELCRKAVPDVRKQVLKGLNDVFSSLKSCTSFGYEKVKAVPSEKTGYEADPGLKSLDDVYYVITTQILPKSETGLRERAKKIGKIFLENASEVCVEQKNELDD